jgi:hypothetical protein
MDLIDRYLVAIAGHLPAAKAEDIIAELRDLLLSRLEEQEAALGRPLDPKEVEAMLKAFGRPLAVAARYGPARYLIGPEVFPYWWACLKTVLLIDSAVIVTLCFADLLFAVGPSGRIVGQVTNAVWTSVWATTGSVTVFFAILERMGPRARQALDWDPPALPRFRETEQSRWNRVSQITGSTVLLLWCVGILKIRLPHSWSVALTLHPAGLWPDIYWPVIGLLCAGIAVDLVALVRPDLNLARVLAFVATRVGWFALAVFVWDAEPWVSLTHPSLAPFKVARLEMALDWTIRITILGIALAMIIGGAREAWRLARRQRGRNGGAALHTR